MVKGTTIGIIILTIGIILLIIYGLLLGFEEIMQALDIFTGFIAGLIIVGFIVLIISTVLEQHETSKKMKEKINKEDLKP